METDILGGVQMGFKTVLTLTGSTKKEDLGKFAYAPDFVVNSIHDLLDEGVFSEITGLDFALT